MTLGVVAVIGSGCALRRWEPPEHPELIRSILFDARTIDLGEETVRCEFLATLREKLAADGIEVVSAAFNQTRKQTFGPLGERAPVRIFNEFGVTFHTRAPEYHVKGGTGRAAGLTCGVVITTADATTPTGSGRISATSGAEVRTVRRRLPESYRWLRQDGSAASIDEIAAVHDRFLAAVRDAFLSSLPDAHYSESYPAYCVVVK